MRVSLQPIPQDSIQAISANDEFIIISAWDCSIHVYDMQKKIQVTEFKTPTPTLSLAIFGRDIYCGCADGWILKREIQQSQPEEFLRLAGAVRTLNVYKSYLIASSLSSELVSINLQDKSKRSHELLKERIFCASLQGDRYLAACARRTYSVYGLSEEGNILKFKLFRTKESPLRHQTRSCCLLTDGTPILASVEGRVAVESQTPFAFRAHRLIRNENLPPLDHPVNSMAIYNSGQLFTAGSDGNIYVWDLNSRRKIYKVQESYAISNIYIFKNILIVAKSYNWENREAGKSSEQVELIVYDITSFGLQ